MSCNYISDYQLSYIRSGCARYSHDYLIYMGKDELEYKTTELNLSTLRIINCLGYKERYPLSNLEYKCVNFEIIENTDPLQLLKYCQSLKYQCGDYTNALARPSYTWLSKLITVLKDSIIENHTSYPTKQWIAGIDPKSHVEKQGNN